MKNFKKLLCVCLIACICLCAIGCNKNTDTNSSGLSSKITQTETSSIDNKIENTEENTSSEESKVSKDKTETAESETNKEDSETNSTSNNNSSQKPTSSNNLNSQNNETINNDIDKKVDEIFKYCDKIKIKEDDIYYDVVDVFNANGRFEGVITSDGSAYIISPKLPFSNGKTYKKIDSEVSFVKHFRNTDNEWGDDYFLSTDFKLYHLLCDEKNNFSFTYVKTIEKFCSNAKQVLDLDGSYYENNKIYSATEKKFIYTFPNNVNIEYKHNSIIKTNMGYYYFKTEYKQEFADSEPIAKLVVEKAEIPKEIDYIWSGSTGFSFGVYKDILYYGTLFT